jgi:uncharacterized protein (DUF1330 family)
MAKGYWICCYDSIANPAAVGDYAKVAGPVLQAAGGRALVRGVPAKTFEGGRNQRTVIVEFDSVQQAIATYESAAYQAAVKLLQGAAVRDLRIVEGLD